MEFRRNRGFTILEISLVMVILGLMGMLALNKYKATVASNYLEKAANGLYLELRSLRPLAFKYDGTVRATFNKYAGSVKVEVETTNEDGGTVFRQVKIYKVEAPVKMGTPPEKPYQWKFYPPNESNEWNTALLVDPDTRGEYTFGAVYLYNPKFPKIIYCIGITTSMQSIELHKWDGKAWTIKPL